MEDFILRVKCPVCMKNLGEENIDDTLVLLGDEEQNMQCLGCGYGSNNDMKSHISDNPFPQEFKDVCEKIGDRFWAPSVFTTANYQVVPMVEDTELKWRVYAHQDPETEVLVPTFTDAYKMVEKMETIIGEKIQQQADN
tara:strand:+ start:2108 stop:2524 length:417 start_codon:yes stop_codon:yes gene_type:complete